METQIKRDREKERDKDGESERQRKRNTEKVAGTYRKSRVEDGQTGRG